MRPMTGGDDIVYADSTTSGPLRFVRPVGGADTLYRTKIRRQRNQYTALSVVIDTFEIERYMHILYFVY